MQKTGQITNIVSDGGYDSQGGYINTFQMTINTDTGQMTGQIGSKSQQYPKNVGEEIIVEITNTEYGTRFKKINPQHAGGNQQGGSRPAQSSRQDTDWDAIAEGKTRCAVVCAAIQGGQLPCTSIGQADKYVSYAMDGRATAGVTQPQQQQYNNAAPKPPATPAPPAPQQPLDDDIPF